MKATQRATGKMLGVGKATVQRDVGPNGPKRKPEPSSVQEETEDLGPSGPNTLPPVISQSGTEAAKQAGKAAATPVAALSLRRSLRGGSWARPEGRSLILRGSEGVCRA